MAFIAHVLANTEPKSYQQACQHPQWVAAMDSELTALEENETWELTTLQVGCKAILLNGYTKSSIDLMGVWKSLRLG